MTNPSEVNRSPHPVLNRRIVALIWEVYARIGLRPEQAVHLLRRQGIKTTPVEAGQQMAAARRRNHLKLVSFS